MPLVTERQCIYSIWFWLSTFYKLRLWLLDRWEDADSLLRNKTMCIVSEFIFIWSTSCINYSEQRFVGLPDHDLWFLPYIKINDFDDAELLVIAMFCNHHVVPWVSCPVQHQRRIHIAYVELGVFRHLLHKITKKIYFTRKLLIQIK